MIKKIKHDIAVGNHTRQRDGGIALSSRELLEVMEPGQQQGSSRGMERGAVVVGLEAEVTLAVIQKA